MDAIQSVLEAGSKLWLDSVDPELVEQNRLWGITGATSNPVIIADLVQSGRFDNLVLSCFERGCDDERAAWRVTDHLVSLAEQQFMPAWEATEGDDGYVSFELDPLVDADDSELTIEQRIQRYIELGRKWSEDHPNRLIKVPATPAGIGSLQALVGDGVNVNVTLMFTQRQYVAARDAVWRGAQTRRNLDQFKSTYSIFVSRLDDYAGKQAMQLSPEVRSLVGIVTAKRVWRMNQMYWLDKKTPLRQEIVFASTGVKSEDEPADKYVRAFAGGDILTNKPATHQMLSESSESYPPAIEAMPSMESLQEIDGKLDMARVERDLLEEGLRKFAQPHRGLLESIAAKRRELRGELRRAG